MPRTNDTQYLARCRLIYRIWHERQLSFAYLSFADQRALHEYFQPAIELTDLALLAHRRQISREQPSLPQRAGRAHSHLASAIWQTPVSITIDGPGRRQRTLSARGLVRPEIDVQCIASSVIAQITASLADLPTASPPHLELGGPSAPSTSPHPPPQLPDDYPSHPHTARPSDLGPSS